MPRIEMDVNPVVHITTDAIGQPGQRVFYIQALTADNTVTVIVEKVQIQTLALGVEDFLSEVAQRYPDLAAVTPDYDETRMHIQPPVDPLFRVGELGLAYDADQDMAVLVVREIVNAESQTQDDVSVIRFWCTRAQLLALGRWGLEVSGRGRPVCPLCGQPIEPAGHFCPKRNGHKH
jgi:uncharacterized repeat protein (TIGR03847 family)